MSLQNLAGRGLWTLFIVETFFSFYSFPDMGYFVVLGMRCDRAADMWTKAFNLRLYIF